MNRKLSLEGITLKFFYEKYKKYLLPVLVIVASLGLFFQVTLPFLTEYRNLEELREVEEQKLSTLRNNYTILLSADENLIDSRLALTTDALPPGKDFASILNAVSISARNSGVVLGDYEFQVGDLSQITPSVKYPSLELALTVSGSIRSVVNFMDEIYTSLPLAEVVSVEMNNDRSVVKVNFYYKSLPGTPPVASPIQSLSSQNQTILNTISTWNNGNTVFDIIPVVASPSATSASPF